MVLLFTSLYLTKELHFSISQAGLIMSMYVIGSIIGSYLGGWLTDRINFFYLLVFSQVVSGLILLLMIVGKTALEISAVVFFMHWLRMYLGRQIQLLLPLLVIRQTELVHFLWCDWQ